MRLYTPSTINDIREKHGFNFTKTLGQNFLVDKNIVDSIVDGASITEDDLVIEIGPGIGVITAEAAERAGRVVAIEIDKNLIPILEETLDEYENVSIINRDVLKTDLREVIEEYGTGGQVKIIGNLPYYITTPIIMKILEEGIAAESITIMMQKEVADRIKAAPGSKLYGGLSAAVQYYCTIEHIAKAPKEAFMPRPKIDSTVLRLDIRKERPVELLDEKVFFRCIKAGFEQRRKTLLNSLGGTGFGKDDIRQILEDAGIDPVRRMETLNLQELADLANSMARYSNR